MREYFMTLLGVCLIAGSASMLFLDEKGALSKNMNLVLALCVLSVVISPILSVIGEIRDGEFKFLLLGEEYGDTYAFEEIFEENLARESVCEIEKRLSALLCEKLDAREDEISVSLEYGEDGERLTLLGARVFLSGSAIFKDPRDAKEYVEEILSCECEVFWGKEEI